MLGNAIGRQLMIDDTGLTGRFDVDLRWAPDGVVSNASTDGPSIFTAVQEQLGLRLQARRTARDVLVIDHIERPSED
jgi:uncharacterized protein (TIGR03435 family)